MALAMMMQYDTTYQIMYQRFAKDCGNNSVEKGIADHNAYIDSILQVKSQGEAKEAAIPESRINMSSDSIAINALQPSDVVEFQGPIYSSFSQFARFDPRRENSGCCRTAPAIASAPADSP